MQKKKTWVKLIKFKISPLLLSNGPSLRCKLGWQDVSEGYSQPSANLTTLRKTSEGKIDIRKVAFLALSPIVLPSSKNHTPLCPTPTYSHLAFFPLGFLSAALICWAPSSILDLPLHLPGYHMVRI